MRGVVNPSDPLLKETIPLILVAVLEKNTAIRSSAEDAVLVLFKDPDRLQVIIP